MRLNRRVRNRTHGGVRGRGYSAPPTRLEELCSGVDDHVVVTGFLHGEAVEHNTAVGDVDGGLSAVDVKSLPCAKGGGRAAARSEGLYQFLTAHERFGSCPYELHSPVFCAIILQTKGRDCG